MEEGNVKEINKLHNILEGDLKKGMDTVNKKRDTIAWLKVRTINAVCTFIACETKTIRMISLLKNCLLHLLYSLTGSLNVTSKQYQKPVINLY
jgi:hypothetical protein